MFGSFARIGRCHKGAHDGNTVQLSPSRERGRLKSDSRGILSVQPPNCYGSKSRILNGNSGQDFTQPLYSARRNREAFGWGVKNGTNPFSLEGAIPARNLDNLHHHEPPSQLPLYYLRLRR
jgi:hypothetical protein